MSELVRTSGHESRDIRDLVFNHYTKNPERNTLQVGEVESN